jgi:molybdate transport system regulatory protein
MVHREKTKQKRYIKPQGEAPYVLKGRVWVEGPDGTFLGYGRVVLMERIQEHGSITKAAKSMDMSYRHAWELIDSMNHQSHEPLVITSTGGKKGGGTVVTKEGERAIKKFWKAQDALKRFLKKEGIRFELKEKKK